MSKVLLDTNGYSALLNGDKKWIAAHCIEHGCVLLTYDQHFQYIAGLRTMGS